MQPAEAGEQETAAESIADVQPEEAAEASDYASPQETAIPMPESPIPEVVVAAEQAAQTASISGLLWLDMLEGNGAKYSDGIQQPNEAPLGYYDVSLYLVEDKTSPVATVTTNGGGHYKFKELAPGQYVVGISSVEKDGTKYLLPTTGLTPDNMFADFNEGKTIVYSQPIFLESGMDVTDIDCGMRTPLLAAPRTGMYVVTETASNAPRGTYSTLAAAVAACYNNVPCTITAIADDLTLDATVTIPATKQIILKSDGTLRTIVRSTTNTNTTNARHLVVEGKLTLENIVLEGAGLTSGTNYNGGVYVSGTSASLTMNAGAAITGCYSQYGGGVYTSAPATFAMTGGQITNNKAAIDGGGLYTSSYEYENPALLVNTSSPCYANISIAGSAVFSGNTAGQRFQAPVNYREFNTRILNPFPGILLNNADINYRNLGYVIAYHVNNTTNAPVVYQKTTTTNNSISITLFTQAQAGFTTANGAIEPGKERLLGWNSQPDSSGQSYAVGQLTVISSSLNLYAQWGSYRYIVTKDSDGSVVGSYNLLADAVTNCGIFATNGSYTITATEDDPAMGTAAVTIPATKQITLKSDGTHRTITQQANARHLMVQGKLTLEDITLAGISSTSAYNGGIATSSTSASLTMNNGAAITKCFYNFGSGVDMNGGIFTMNGTAKIFDNRSYLDGGGVRLISGTLMMNGGEISGNATSGYGFGGGLHIESNGSATISGGKISGNTSDYGGGVFVNGGSITISSGEISGNTSDYGGGVHVESGLITISGGEISGNTADYGGGVFISGVPVFSMFGGEISGNTATTDGGGIYSSNTTTINPILPVTSYYNNISITGTASVFGNTSSQLSAPPTNYTDFDTRAPNPFPGHLLNNNEINYRNSFFTVMYNANNSDLGTQWYYQRTNVSTSYTVVQAVNVGSGTGAANFTAPTGMRFAGWTTNADGSGTLYQPETSIILRSSMILYAKWEQTCDVSISKTITGAYADMTKDNIFTIALRSSGGSPITGSYNYMGSSIPGSGVTAPANGSLNFNAAGQATLPLKHGQIVTIEDLLPGSEILISETPDWNYNTTIQDSESASPMTGTDTGWKALSTAKRSFDFTNRRTLVTPTGVSAGNGGADMLLLSLAVILAAGIAGVIIYRRRKAKRYE
ncbi:DUF7601 domain-containing protein [Christensenella tenuis]|uniref:InlB B-repeat-containing protein n=1 Tax=Christensenella tenuis TaxID=2763033 RepID=A0ABR7EEG3_9FIRM|nr:InlB B-repeat-containing protein [Christensenella tenuis]